MYCAQRTVWSSMMYMKNKGIEFVMVNNQYRLDDSSYFPTEDQRWILPADERLGDLLDVNLDNGFPEESEQHKYFWPCESHPNIHGHKKIANKNETLTIVQLE